MYLQLKRHYQCLYYNTRGHLFPDVYFDRGDNDSQFAPDVDNSSSKLPPWCQQLQQ